MSKPVYLYEISDAMKEVLKSGGEVSFVTAGYSMLPILRNRTDKVVLARAGGRLKKHDVPLYVRPDGRYVLHRIIGVDGSGYKTRGDNQREVECGVRDEQIIAVLKAFYRNGKLIKCTDFKYRCYCRFLPLVRLYRFRLYPIYVKLAAPLVRKIKSNTGE